MKFVFFFYPVCLPNLISWDFRLGSLGRSVSACQILSLGSSFFAHCLFTLFIYVSHFSLALFAWYANLSLFISRSFPQRGISTPSRCACKIHMEIEQFNVNQLKYSRLYMQICPLPRLLPPAIYGYMKNNLSFLFAKCIEYCSKKEKTVFDLRTLSFFLSLSMRTKKSEREI